MGEWNIDTQGRNGILKLTLKGAMSLDEMRAMVKTHNAAIRAFGTKPYRVLCDLRGLMPMGPDCTDEFARAKKVSNERPNFKGSAVLVDAKFIGLQHRRTAAEAGVADTELTTENEDEAWRFLDGVDRSRAAGS